MNISEKNRNNVISRWKKEHKTDYDYIKKNKFLGLKSRLCGFIAGDGNILFDNKKTCRHNTVRFYPDHVSMIKAFNESLLKVYNKNPKIKNKGNYYCVTLDSKPIVEDLLEVGKFGKLDWNIPSFVFNSIKNKKEWLRAYFDCEAYIHKKHIMIKSVNEKGLIQVKELLDEFKIYSKFYSHNPKNKNHNTYFMLVIGKLEDRKKYLDIIGFNHTAKLKKLNNQIYSNAAVA